GRLEAGQVGGIDVLEIVDEEVELAGDPHGVQILDVERVLVDRPLVEVGELDTAGGGRRGRPDRPGGDHGDTGRQRHGAGQRGDTGWTSQRQTHLIQGPGRSPEIISKETLSYRSRARRARVIAWFHSSSGGSTWSSSRSSW